MRYGSCLSKSGRRTLAVCLMFLGVASLGLVLSGCSDNGLVVTNDQSDDYVSFFDQPYYPDAVAKRSDVVDASFRYVESKLLAEQGGVIALNDNEDLEAFVVLPGSFPTDTTFTVSVTKLVTDDGETPVIYDFGPDGLQFSRPAVLRLNVGELFGKNVTTMTLYWLNEETNLWECQDTCQVDDQYYVYVSIEHFSTYAANAGAATGVFK